MNQGEMVERIAWEFNLTKAESERILKFILEEMKKDLMVGERVYFRGFGAFHKEKRSEREVRHPETGKLIKIPEHFTVDFNPSKSLEELVNQTDEIRE